VSTAAQTPEPKNVLQAAEAARESGDIANAIRLYREFLKEHPDAAEIRSNLGAVLARDGQFVAAIVEYQRALAQIPANPHVRMNLALAYYKLGRLAEAIKELQLLHDLQPADTKPAVLLADCLLQSGQWQSAVDLLKPLSEEDPDDRAVAYMLAMALLKQDRTAEAQVLLDRIVREGASAEGAYLLGQSEYLRENLPAAAGHLARAIELNPNLRGLHSLYGQVLRRMGKFDAATEQFRAELNVNAYDFTANTEVAMLLKQEGKLDEASQHFAKALQVRPGDPGVLLQRASIAMMQKRLNDAREELEQLVRDHPDFSEAHAALATAYYRLKRTADGDRERAAARRAQSEVQKRLDESRATAESAKP
jgi:tetratricopeptide (TPR) repeat protein